MFLFKGGEDNFIVYIFVYIFSVLFYVERFYMFFEMFGYLYWWKYLNLLYYDIFVIECSIKYMYLIDMLLF